MANKNILWIVIGVLAVLVIIYFAATTDFSKVSNNGAEGNREVGQVLAPGTSPVSTKGQVLGANGEVAQNNAEWGTAGAPKQSNPLSVKDLPKNSVTLNVSAAGFVPNSFTVKAGQAVVLAVSSKDATHLFHFSDPSLKAVAIGIGPNETRAITFNAPQQKGQYAFNCDVPGHAGRGETGVMIVE